MVVLSSIAENSPVNVLFMALSFGECCGFRAVAIGRGQPLRRSEAHRELVSWTGIGVGMFDGVAARHTDHHKGLGLDLAAGWG
jgi:hypothetical protein